MFPFQKSLWFVVTLPRMDKVPYGLKKKQVKKKNFGLAGQVLNSLNF